MLEKLARELRSGRWQPRPRLRAAVRGSAVPSTSGATDCECSRTPRLDGPAFAENTPVRAITASAISWTGSAPIVAWDVSAATPGGGLGTCSVSLRLPLAIWKQLRGSVALTFFFLPCGTGNRQHQLFDYYWGRGYDFIVCLFMKMKNKKLYILHI
uniref:Natriuretic peptide C n=1 Tax=Myotis myotis TaxID=51298 RepID=A0A7J7WIG2_MYOMY|nr:natriuretic peptide C [Myotis myotis]